MSLLTQVLIAGIVTGSIYALVALAFTLILKVIDMVNFAQGDFLMVGAFLFYGITVRLSWPPYVGIPVALIAAFIFGVAIGRFLVFPVRKSGGMSLLIIAIGLGIVFEDVTRMIFGANAIGVSSVLGVGTVNVGSLVVTRNDIGILVTTGTCVTALTLFLKTRLGTAIRATASDVEMASLSGTNIRFIIGLTFGLSMVLSTMAGVFLAPRTQLINTMGIALLFKSFAGAVIGGFGSIPGAVVGGVVVGLLDSLVAFYISSAYASAISFAVLIVILIVRPSGLWGERAR